MNEMNIFTTTFTRDNKGSCLKHPPKDFNWVFNILPEDISKPVVYFDEAMFTFINDGYKGPRYGWLGESSEIISNLIRGVTSNRSLFKMKYKKIYVNDKRILEIDPEFFEYCPPASNMPWIEEKDYAVYEKTEHCSYITSFKHSTSGHIKRMQLFEMLKNDPRYQDHIYGRDYRPLLNKIDGMKNYRFSIVIENSVYPKYYTEKVTDCFATGTVPVYIGDRSICEDFNKEGIIFLDDIQSLDVLDVDLYNKMIPAIKDNFEKVKALKTADDIIFSKITNDAN
jgi:hypothetical protein